MTTMRKVFDLESESHWQAYRIANVFLVWKVDDPEQKEQAQKIIAQVIREWYRIGRRHERMNLKVKRLPKRVCGTCDVTLTESNYGGMTNKDAKVIPNCKKCYYAKYENFEKKPEESQDRRGIDGNLK